MVVANIVHGPALYQLANDQALIWWETDTAPNQDRLDYWTSGGGAPEAVTPISTGVSTQVGTARYTHRVLLTDLSPGTRHYFRLYAPNFETPEVLPYVFETYKDDGSSVKLGVWGNNEFNSGSTVPGLGATLDAMDAKNVHGYMTVGGLVGDGAVYEDWENDWLSRLDTRLQTKGLTGVRGDSDGTSLLARAMYPVGMVQPNYFAHTIGVARVIGLNSVSGFSRKELQQGKLQHNWVVQQAAKDTAWKTASYRILVVHNPFRTTFWNDTCDYGTAGTIQDLTPLHDLVKLSGADLVLYGYSRSYQRGSYESTYQDNTHDIHHVVTGGGGAWKHSNRCFTWSPPQEPNIVKDSSDYHYLTLDISSTRLQLDAHSLESGEVLDSLSIAPHVLY